MKKSHHALPPIHVPGLCKAHHKIHGCRVEWRLWQVKWMITASDFNSTQWEICLLHEHPVYPRRCSYWSLKKERAHIHTPALQARHLRLQENNCLVSCLAPPSTPIKANLWKIEQKVGQSKTPYLRDGWISAHKQQWSCSWWCGPTICIRENETKEVTEIRFTAYGGWKDPWCINTCSQGMFSSYSSSIRQWSFNCLKLHNCKDIFFILINLSRFSKYIFI